ncbi:DUF1835 domain-containing protein [Fibrella arboris]|uniref:DUF1835 domain-containing protein n=1 Tax=Fibrella arboris TaxID=3242486 RepID=UPI0035208740
MIYHVLNGDALYDRFVATQLDGQVVIDRECLIVGDVSGDTLADFWANRAAYIEATYHETRGTYFQRVVGEFDKILAAPDRSDINLWFGYDLFCQVNMWFVLSLLYKHTNTYSVFVVYPAHLNRDAIWDDFGGATVGDLRYCSTHKVAFTSADLALGNALWNAYQTNDLARLAELATAESPCFPYLNDVCRAHIERTGIDGKPGRPERVLDTIMSEGPTDFPSVFTAFYKREGIYGFGDSQVKPLYDSLMNR